MFQGSNVVVVGIDGSKASDAAVAWADSYAKATDSKLLLVSVWEWATAYGRPMMFEGYHPDTDALALVEKARSGLTIAPDRVETLAREGHAGHVLVDVASTAALLVVGAEGHRGVSTILLGSTSSYCLHHATCPVLVVR